MGMIVIDDAGDAAPIISKILFLGLNFVSRLTLSSQVYNLFCMNGNSINAQKVSRSFSFLLNVVFIYSAFCSPVEN